MYPIYSYNDRYNQRKVIVLNMIICFYCYYYYFQIVLPLNEKSTALHENIIDSFLNIATCRSARKSNNRH